MHLHAMKSIDLFIEQTGRDLKCIDIIHWILKDFPGIILTVLDI